MTLSPDTLPDVAVSLHSPATRWVTLRELAATVSLHLFTVSPTSLPRWRIDIIVLNGQRRVRLAEGLALALARIPEDAPVIAEFMAKCGPELRAKIDELLPAARAITAAMPKIGRGAHLSRSAAA